MRFLQTFAIASALILMPISSKADIFAPSHACYKPVKPYQFNDEWEVESFKREVEMYKQCIEDFVEEQEDQIQTHQDAAQEAIDEWNAFVNYEL